ncbi:Ubiquitin thioesterase otubain-like protein [Emericellopsis cladophorae]|uniref:ubiquitinyl hydrolase 1 n=1 Tax=Emericellopsis cladophorae TaxID=2686198 RepID=A0A9Q0BF31_9HYPO|nr:Ubiquitin thioesterase otubain-like protein [Emericellopsis cladophorae]KAI6781864.1 Ubiquitin thioesterase otubain-like protein [Emericellopsis cladophorae]
MEDQDPHGMAAQQAAAKEYQPDLPNYLVGDRMPSSAITEEYAKADATPFPDNIRTTDLFKAMATAVGEASLGSAATIGFAYFEKLVEAGVAQIESECNRLIGMNSMLTDIGGYAFELYEDWADDFISCLREVGSHAGTPMAHALLFQKWNDGPTTAGYIYYMRLLAATYLKANADTYDPFIADNGGIHGYCQHSIEMVNREIEHLGITALVNVLLKPVNMVLEIAYLDRSPGNQVNKYRLPEEANSLSEASLGPIIYLLYRPDHYDILYREPQPLSIQVHRVNSVSDNAGIASIHEDPNAFGAMDLTSLAMIPGFTENMPIRPSNVDQQGKLLRHDPWVQSFAMPVSTPTPPMVAPPSNPSLSPHSAMGPSQPPPPPSEVSSGMMTTAPECTIRFSALQYQYDGGNSGPVEPFQVTTSTFKNSVWNRAHFGNPDFHPEEWSPEDENIDGRLGVAKRRGSKRD